jgi:hypothetical protein
VDSRPTVARSSATCSKRASWRGAGPAAGSPRTPCIPGSSPPASATRAAASSPTGSGSQSCSPSRPSAGPTRSSTWRPPLKWRTSPARTSTGVAPSRPRPRRGTTAPPGSSGSRRRAWPASSPRRVPEGPELAPGTEIGRCPGVGQRGEVLERIGGTARTTAGLVPDGDDPPLQLPDQEVVATVVSQAHMVDIVLVSICQFLGGVAVGVLAHGKGGGSFSRSQNSPSCFTASANVSNSTGFTT